jgi:hypothetical protein
MRRRVIPLIAAVLLLPPAIVWGIGCGWRGPAASALARAAHPRTDDGANGAAQAG